MDAIIEPLGHPLARPRPAWRMAVAAALVGHALTLGSAMVWLRSQPPERLAGPEPVIFVSLGLAGPADGGEPVSLPLAAGPLSLSEDGAEEADRSVVAPRSENGALPLAGQALAETTVPVEAQVSLKPKLSQPPQPARAKRPKSALIPAATSAAPAPEPGPSPARLGSGDAVPGEAAPSAGGGTPFGEGRGPGTDPGPGGFGGGAGPFLAGQVDQDPVVLARVEPVYPALARRRSLSGRVLVRFRVDETGLVDQVSVVEARPEGVFEPAVLAALPRWRFQPGKYRGREVATWVMLPVEFKLVD